MATAVAFVVGSSLAARLRAGVFPMYFAGVGIGIILSGFVVPPALSAGDWRLGWLVLGLASLVALAPAWLAARAVPESSARPAATLSLTDVRRLGPTLFAYGLFGAGYVSYMTFRNRAAARSVTARLGARSVLAHARHVIRPLHRALGPLHRPHARRQRQGRGVAGR